jgi:hypothetical protein
MVKQGYRYKAGRKIGYYEGPGGRHTYEPGNEADRRRAKKRAEGKQLSQTFPDDASFTW